MSLARMQGRLELPEALRTQLRDFRRRVWSVKMAEAACVAALVVAAAFLAMFGLDRVWETPGWPRALLFVASGLGLAAVPIALHRWVWRRRRPDQLARLIGGRLPRLGDQLLGVIELVECDSEQARSRELCEAAIRQVAADAGKRDLRDASPRSRHRLWAGLLIAPAATAAGLFVLFPAAASNAWVRMIAPWRDTPRYAFALVEPTPARLVVPHGEPFSYRVSLAGSAAWRPGKGEARLDHGPPVVATLGDGGYTFDLPARIAPGRLDLRVGDTWRSLRVEPTVRPELSSVVADVTLPDYLGRPGTERRDVRGGALTLVKGSLARFAATASRALAAAKVDGSSRPPAGATVTSPGIRVDGPRTVEFRWQDELGLAGKEPFSLALAAGDDEPPTLAIEDLPRQKVLLETELVRFKVSAHDDFGVRRVGLEWRGLDAGSGKAPARGEQVLAAGKADAEDLALGGTFSAKGLGIEPQPVGVRVFAEDYLPGRPRVYSPTYTFYVLSPDQHAIWVTEQLSKWHRQSLEVRDREMGLHETNKGLRALSPDELDRPESRRQVENQASAERSNGRRLSALTASGEDLVKQASRNPEIGVGHLEKWAEMLGVLKDISANRMPSVADLLKDAAQAPASALASASPPPANRAPSAGPVRASGGGKPSEGPAKAAPPTAVPQVVDRESSQNSPDTSPAGPAAKSKGSTPRLTLPVTTVVGKGGPAGPPPPPAPDALDEAVRQQRDLLAEFEKVSEELNRVLANLEGSTLVKRLKAASRVQTKIAGRLNEGVSDTFGVPTPRIADGPARGLIALADQELAGSRDVSRIMDDMHAYFERRRFAQFKAVLDEMRKADAIGSLRQLGTDIKVEQGVSIAQCEFWSDTLDRWAEDLVDPACKGTCPGGKSKDSLPPSIVLEVLQILEGEVNLREETRVAQQARPALEADEFGRQAGGLSGSQKGLGGRVEKVIGRIKELPESEVHFADEIGLLGQVAAVMEEATGILARPETGDPAVAAETEAIELLLKSKRINPKGGGGGGASPGGGGSGSTKDSALALLGTGVNEKEVREDRGVSQVTGVSGPALPEEFRAGLDEYFNRLERAPAAR